MPMFRTALLLSAATLVASADEPKTLQGVPKDWDGAVKIGPAQILDTPELTTIRISTEPADGKTDTKTEPIEFKIEWKNEKPDLESFQRTLNTKQSMTTSGHRSGMTSITRELVYSSEYKALLIHLQADQPGALTFTTSFVTDGKLTAVDRLETQWQGNKTDQKARVWVIPFESEVYNKGGVQTIPGEGEALIILNADGENTYKTLADRFDPGHPHPNPWQIWQEFLKARKTD
ncbi:glycoside hydrolase N-terminal domain-containing protein [Luteolibacter pohnpeiensis]|uniref:Glycoside hydrolase N-terminal domain-containing protein n=1 Tax=Luteolibacter pohnpeiensis TaxID=454153 RepID=A0A934S9J1_9BACT|nr:glycoside hydrolase N-terminal domain-containing protein [Luteolibacter pohnpeiensis]MBK1881298.1 glycoside hydrolase N-terminal domain-containing protein [Luteolibacter pohnpeiensis]